MKLSPGDPQITRLQHGKPRSLVIANGPGPIDIVCVFNGDGENCVTLKLCKMIPNICTT